MTFSSFLFEIIMNKILGMDSELLSTVRMLFENVTIDRAITFTNPEQRPES